MLIIEIALGIVFGLVLLSIVLVLLEKYMDHILNFIALAVVAAIVLMVLGSFVRLFE